MHPRALASSLFFWAALALSPAPLAAHAAGGASGAAPANLLREEAAHRSARIHGVSYQLDLELLAKSEVYRGETTVAFTLGERRDGLWLDFQGEEVRGLWINGEAVAKPAFAEHRIQLPEAKLRAGSNTVKVRYENAYDNDGAGLHKSVDPADGAEYVYTQFEPFDANRLFPCFDQPDLKATYTTRIKAPHHWKVITNGAFQRIDGAGYHRFATTERFSTYIVALAAGPFHEWVDPKARIPSNLYVTKSMTPHADPENIFRVTREGFDFFEDYFGIPYPFGKYDQIFVPQFNWGAMENVGCVIFNDRMIFRKTPTQAELERRANTILHEMAHMWFGDIVTMKWWNDLWLNESFATYMAHLGLVQATRFKDAWESFARGTKGWAYWQDQLPTTHPIETEVPDTRTTFKNFDGITYGKGASTLKQLAFYVGEEAFRQGTSAYLKANAWGNATRADYVGSLAKAAGLDLEGWTKKWLHTSGVNTITPSYQTDSSGKISSFWLDQGRGNGDRILRPHRLKVALYQVGPGGKARRGKVVTVRVTGARTRVPELEGEPAPSFVDANHEDHAFAKVFLDPASLAYAKAHLEDLPGSALRTKVWQALWFMVRDAATPPTDYLDLFLAKADSETDAKLLSSILGRVDDALGSYLTEEIKRRYLPRVSSLCWHQVRQAPAGSDLQEAWFQGALRTVENRISAVRLPALLEGRRSIDGLRLDQPNRWKVLTRLAAVGHPAAAGLLAAEKQRDVTEKGARAAYQVEVASPDPLVKAAAWKRFNEDRETPLDLLRAGMRAFWWHHQADSLRPYVRAYFEALPEVAARGGYFADSFAERLFPGACVSQATLEAAEAFLEQAATDSALSEVQRPVAEGADELRRALRIRATLEEPETP